MKRTILTAIAILVGASTPVFFASAQANPAAVKLLVPYVSEAPGNSWYGSWKNACEEASIAMLQYYYSGQAKETVAQSKTFMQALFAKERRLWGSDANSDAEQTLRLITDYSSFSAKIVEAPTLEAIKAELAAGRPVIVPLNGFTLANPHIPFLRSGSGYHMFVIVGYDDTTGDFLAHDTGDNVDGVYHRYGYEHLLNSIHDYDASRLKADGPARALFTFPKLAKTATSHRIYYLHDGVRQYVSHPAVFAKKGWSWSWVNVVPDTWLSGFRDGAAIGPK